MPQSNTLAAVLIVLVGCTDQTADKPKATIGETAPAAAPAPEAPAAPAAEAPTATGLPFSNDGSSVAFVGSKVTGSHDGHFNEFAGSVTLGPDGAVVGGSVEVTIQTASVEADNGKLTGHLKTGDFFLVEEHPTATFKSTDVAAGEAVDTYTVKGELALRGVSKAIEFPATIIAAEGAATVKAEFSIDRQQFGVTYAGMPDNLIKDDVLIKLDIRTKAATP